MPATTLSRRDLLAGAGAGAAAALLLDPRTSAAQPAPNRPTVFTNTTVVTVDEVRHDVALAVVGNRIAASTDDPGHQNLARKAEDTADHGHAAHRRKRFENAAAHKTLLAKPKALPVFTHRSQTQELRSGLF